MKGDHGKRKQNNPKTFQLNNIFYTNPNV